MHFFEDLRIGTVSELGSHTFQAEEIIRFAEKYDRQIFHLDAEAAKETSFGALVASGWHTAATFMKLFIDYTNRLSAEMRAAGKPVARLGPSPGFENLKWIKPVFVGDTISYTTAIVDKRELKSRPGWGLVTFTNEARNQHGDLVMSFRGKSFLERAPR